MKARPRKFAPSAHITWEGPSLPHFPAGTWAKLESAAGVRLDKEARRAIRKAAEQYVEHDRRQAAAAERTTLTGRRSGKRWKETSPLTVLLDAMNKCVAAWRAAGGGAGYAALGPEAEEAAVRALKYKAQTEDRQPTAKEISKVKAEAVRRRPAALALIDFGAEANVKSHGMIDIEATMARLEPAAFLLRNWIARLDGEAREAVPLFDQFVQQIAHIVRAADGRVAAHGAVYGDRTAKPTEFQRLMRELCLVLPVKTAATEQSFYTDVARALRDAKAGKTPA